MNNQRNEWNGFFRPVVILFIFINSACYFFKNWLKEKNIDADVVMVANALLFVLALINAAIRIRGLKSRNPNVLVRSVTGASFLKLMVIALAVVIYLFKAGENRSIYGLITAMALYVLYTIIETMGAIKMNKKTDGGS